MRTMRHRGRLLLGREAGPSMKSMTGFGKRESLLAHTMVGVEVRSVNHRFCEIVVRLPRVLSEMELTLKDLVKNVCERGRIELSITVNGTGATTKNLQYDHQAAKRYVDALQKMKKTFKLEGGIDVNVLAGFRDIFTTGEEPVLNKAVPKAVLALTRRALTDLEKMRRKEGAALQKDFQGRLRGLEGRLQKVQKRIPVALKEHQERLKGRIAKLLAGEPPPSDRIAQEIVMFAERSDVTEELIRLQSHIGQFRVALTAKGPVGKRLDFLLQEMGREVNTIGSKANDAGISEQVVELKSDLEKIREQVQNIE